ncbi:MAG: hypothetical protein Q9164_002476 [Protoblastenia rupestris]
MALNRDRWRDPHRPVTAEVRFTAIRRDVKYKHLVWSLQKLAKTLYITGFYKGCSFRTYVHDQEYATGLIHRPARAEVGSGESAMFVSKNESANALIPPSNGSAVSIKASELNAILGANLSQTNITAHFPHLISFSTSLIRPRTPIDQKAVLWVIIEAYVRHAFLFAWSLVDVYTIRDPLNLVELLITGGQDTAAVKSRNDYFLYGFKYLTMILSTNPIWYEMAVAMQWNSVNCGGFQLRNVQQGLLASGSRERGGNDYAVETE